MRLMPLPIPRWVISSPIHIRSVAPAVRESTISIALPKVSWPSMISVPPKLCELKSST